MKAKLERVDYAIVEQQKMQYVLYQGISGELANKGIRFYPNFEPTDAMKAEIKRIFWGEIMPKLKLIPWGEEYWPMNQKKAAPDGQAAAEERYGRSLCHGIIPRHAPVVQTALR